MEILNIGKKREVLHGNFFYPAAAAMPATPELFEFVHQRLNEYLTSGKNGPTKFEYLYGTVALAASPRVAEALQALFEMLDTSSTIQTALPVAAAGEHAREGLQRRVKAGDFTKGTPGYWKSVLSALAGIAPDTATSQFLWDIRNTPEWAPLRSCVDVVLARAKWQPLFIEITAQLKGGGVGEPSADTLNTPLSKHILSKLSEESRGSLTSVSRTALLGPNSISLLQYFGKPGWEILASLLSSTDSEVVSAAAIELGTIGPAALNVSEKALQNACEKARIEKSCFALKRVRGEQMENPTPFPWDDRNRVVVLR
ncbi:MAG: hypothetical protein NTY59_12770 [Alphaproteobacteria bacterium]|nr:hypothetical protein [Alphaproteobacteria bacterium]